MKRIALFAVTVLLSSAGMASATINEFTVKLSPELASLVYVTPGIVGVEVPCASNSQPCEFGLEMDMAFAIDSAGLAQATVTEVKIHGDEAMFAQHPGFRESLANNVKALFTDADFNVERDLELGRTNLIASFPTGDDLRLDFDRAKLISMSGGPDFRPVDGAKLTFAYAVPEPSALGLAFAAMPVVWSWLAVRR